MSLDTAAACRVRVCSASLARIDVQSPNPDAVLDNLRERIRQAPGLFNELPALVCINRLREVIPTTAIHQVIEGIGALNMIALGLVVTDAQKPLYRGRLFIPVLTEEDVQVRQPEPAQKSRSTQPTKVIDEPVRSGQQIYQPDGDLILMGPVSRGAEVIAGGNIVAMGPLRGRALAGVSGNTGARIIATQHDAELLSVAGRYALNESIPVQYQAGGIEARINARDELEIYGLPAITS
jgi:septum site-determining protein MinC